LLRSAPVGGWLVCTTRHVDLVAEGFDVAIRAGDIRGATLIARRLYQSEAVAVASPSYLAARGTPADLSELADHDALVGFERGETPRRTWPLRDGSVVTVRPRLASNDLAVLAQGALRGIGIALLPRQFISAALDAGALATVLPEQIGTPAGIWVVYPERRATLPKVRAFVDLAIDWSKTMSFTGLSETTYRARPAP